MSVLLRVEACFSAARDPTAELVAASVERSVTDAVERG